MHRNPRLLRGNCFRTHVAEGASQPAAQLAQLIQTRPGHRDVSVGGHGQRAAQRKGTRQINDPEHLGRWQGELVSSCESISAQLSQIRSLLEIAPLRLFSDT